MRPVAATTLMIGQSLGPLRILERLGEGGMGLLGTAAGLVEIDPQGRILAVERQRDMDPTRLVLVLGWDR